MIRRAHRPVHAAERLEALELRVALERRKTEDPVSGELVLHGLEHADFSANKWSTDSETWGERLDADELAAAASRARLDVVHLNMPDVSRPLSLDGRHCTGGPTELWRKGSTPHLYRGDGVERQLDRIIAGHRVGPICAVEHERALITACAADVQQAIGPTDNSGDQRQSVLKTLVCDGCHLHHPRRDAVDMCRNGIIRDYGSADGHFLAKCVQPELEHDVGRLTRRQGQRFRR